MTISAFESDPTISLHGVSKHFAGARALSEADLAIQRREVHGLLGENGSGKSTLIKILSGFHSPDSGRMVMNGSQIPLPMPPGAARKLGIGFVHQDLGLVPSLTVLENLRIGNYAASTSWRISWQHERRAATSVLEEYGLHVDPSEKVANLTPTQRAMLAIVRAVQDIQAVPRNDDGAGLLVLDETTVFLPQDEKEHLFRVVREIADKRASVLFVSHDLDEIKEITNSVTVLRDGRVQGTVATDNVTTTELVEMIVGRAVEIHQTTHRSDENQGQVAVIVEDLNIDGVAFPKIEAYPGEVVGLTGLPGTGFDRVPQALFGADAPRTGKLTIGNAEHDLRTLNPVKAVQLGIGLLPADRLREGSVGSLPIEDNVMSAVLSRFRTPLGLNRRRITSECKVLMDRYDVRPRDPSKPIATLSGGNQQKALVGKWLQIDMRLWLLHEPTQGVDVGARQQIFLNIRNAAADGMAVLCASNDHEQLAALCDRVLVFGSNGRIQQLQRSQLTKRSISAACFELVDSHSVVTGDGDHP